MPLFYLYPETYQFQNHRPFYFTGMESLQVFYKVGIFLLAFLFVASILERLLKQPRQDSHLVSLAALLVSRKRRMRAAHRSVLPVPVAISSRNLRFPCPSNCFPISSIARIW